VPTRNQTVENAVYLFENAKYPSGFKGETAWLGIYQTLLWYEPVNWLGYKELPHIIDADKLRPSSPAKKRTWTRPSIWQKRANKVNSYLADQLGCLEEEVALKADLLMKHPDYEGMQRQNTLGIAFVGLVKHVMEKFGVMDITYRTEVNAGEIFPGITFPGRSKTPRIDILAESLDIPRAIISAKWSIRHDRLSDLTNECPIYKAAYERIYRHASRRPFMYFVITDEFDPARLSKILDDSCIDGVVHVHKPAVADVCSLNDRLEDLVDLSDFIGQSHQW